MLQVLAVDALPIIILEAVAMIKRWLSIDYFLYKMSRLTVGVPACKEAGRQAGRARNGHVHGYVLALVCSQLVVSRGPCGQIVEVVACGERGRS